MRSTLKSLRRNDHLKDFPPGTKDVQAWLKDFPPTRGGRYSNRLRKNSVRAAVAALCEGVNELKVRPHSPPYEGHQHTCRIQGGSAISSLESPIWNMYRKFSKAILKSNDR